LSEIGGNAFMKPSLPGIFPALTTPFDKGELSLPRLKSNIEKYNRYDLSGYVVLGSTGEGILMNDEEGLKAIETVRSAAAPGKVIIAGTGTDSTRPTIQFTNQAAEAGAQYALVVTPFYYKAQMTAQALEAYFLEVADQSRIPVILYTVPKFTGLDLPVQVMASLAEHPNIVGLKDSSGNISTLGEILKSCPKDFNVLQGSGSVVHASLALGARGAILALADMAPGECVDIYKLAKAGAWEKAREAQLRVITVNQRIVGNYGIPGIKCALDLLGYFGGDPRPPLRRVSQDVRETIGQLLSNAGLL
jgi:4-hydroxy-2-oxoglutarate aldolase